MDDLSSDDGADNDEFEALNDDSEDEDMEDVNDEEEEEEKAPKNAKSSQTSTQKGSPQNGDETTKSTFAQSSQRPRQSFPRPGTLSE